MLQYAMSKNMSLQNGDFRPILALKWPKSQKIHITEACKSKSESTFKITPENITLSIIFDYFHA